MRNPHQGITELTPPPIAFSSPFTECRALFGKRKSLAALTLNTPPCEFSARMPSMIKLYHYTSPHAARLIAQLGIYYGAVGFEDGLNVVPASTPWNPSPGYSTAGANHCALLELEWSGPIVQNPAGGSEPDKLFDLGAHRLFIPQGTTKHLRLTKIRLRKGLQQSNWIFHSSEPRVHLFRPLSWRLIIPCEKAKEIARLRLRDLEAARATIKRVSIQGMPIEVRSFRERPWKTL